MLAEGNMFSNIFYRQIFREIIHDIILCFGNVFADSRLTSDCQNRKNVMDQEGELVIVWSC